MKKLLAAFLCFLSLSVFAGNPVDMLQQTSDQMISALKSNKATLKTHPAYVEGLARNILLPHVDINAMSQLALGRAAWKGANFSQRQAFTKEFTTLLIRTYSGALASYTNETVQFIPLRANAEQNSRVQVDSKILQSGGPAIPVSYRLVKQGSNWKVYDITVDGVSLVQSFRSQFAGELAKGGMNNLLSTLASHNAGQKK